MSDEWIKTLADRRRVKFTNQELDEKAFLTAQVEGNNLALLQEGENEKIPVGCDKGQHPIPGIRSHALGRPPDHHSDNHNEHIERRCDQRKSMVPVLVTVNSQIYQRDACHGSDGAIEPRKRQNTHQAKGQTGRRRRRDCLTDSHKLTPRPVHGRDRRYRSLDKVVPPFGLLLSTAENRGQKVQTKLQGDQRRSGAARRLSRFGGLAG
jgi:hypothetical protein